MTLRPWQTNPEAFEKLAQAARVVKQLAEGDHETELAGLRQALTRVYRAVAFDVDGTITKPGATEIDDDMALVVSGLVRRGVPVFLITGRGRGGARSAAHEMASRAGLLNDDGSIAFPYVRRLRCVTHNGIYLLQTEQNGAFLGCEELLYEAPSDFYRWHGEIAEILAGLTDLPRGAYGLRPEPEPGSVRVEFRTPEARERALPAIQAWIDAQQVPGLHITVGTYGDLSMLDVGVPDKGDAVQGCAERLGVFPDQVLRIGDQGHEGGNDYNFLAVASGFSVDRLSSVPGVCHPVLDAHGAQLRASSATRSLIDQVYLFAPLSVAPDRKAVEQRLIAFERFAIAAALTETLSFERLLTVKVRQLLAHDPEGRDAPIRLESLFDTRSGGIRLANWELQDALSWPAIAAAFSLQALDRETDAEHGSPRAMYTDSGVLLRGPAYYASLWGNRNAARLPDFIGSARGFIARAIDAVRESVDRSGDPDLVQVKTLLGIMDNVRDVALQLLNVGLLLCEPPGDTPPAGPAIVRRLVNELALPHTRQHLSFLLDAHEPWPSTLRQYVDLLQKGFELVTALHEELPAAVEARSAASSAWAARWADNSEFFKWREADHIIQNIVASQIGLRRIIGSAPTDPAPLAIGLAYGGLELPLVAGVLGERMGRPVVPAVARVSVYGDRETGERVRRGDPDYVPDIVKTQGPVISLHDGNVLAAIADREVVLLDDNCTTGVTLQLARDLMVYRGADVIGAIIVRFPGSNRAVHMAQPNHGFLDLDLAFGFVWGFVASSPYARLIVPGSSTETLYEDENGVFDKAKQRIRYLLRKNDPTSFPDGVAPSCRRYGTEEERTQ